MEDKAYKIFIGLISKSNDILMQYFNIVQNFHDQIAEVEPNDLDPKFKEKIDMFKNYINEKDGKMLFGVVLENEALDAIIKTKHKFINDKNKMSLEELMKKYDINENVDFDVDLAEIFKSDNNVICMYKDIDSSNFTELINYVNNNVHSLDYNLVTKHNIEKILDDKNNKKIEVVCDTKEQKDIIANEMNAKGFDFQINFHNDSYGIIFNKYETINDKLEDVEEWVLNMIHNNPHLTKLERAKIIVENEKNINDREVSVKEFKKAIEIKR